MLWEGNEISDGKALEREEEPKDWRARAQCVAMAAVVRDGRGSTRIHYHRGQGRDLK